MSVAVLGCGRTGTNMVLEILATSPELSESDPPEDKKLFRRDPGTKYPDDYLTKCDTVYFDVYEMREGMVDNPGMKMVWTIRDPRDMVLSKMRRGVPKSEGGDGKVLADDATEEGCMADIKDMMLRHDAAKRMWPYRYCIVRMEDVILNFEETVRGLCGFVGVLYLEEMKDFPSRMRLAAKRSRYSTLDQSQVGLWRDWENVYDGFFRERDVDVPGMFEKVMPYVEAFGYELE